MKDNGEERMLSGPDFSERRRLRRQDEEQDGWWPRPQLPLFPTIRIWLMIVSFEMLVMTASAWLFPSWLQSLAYETAFQILPTAAWGGIALSVAVACTAGFYTHRGELVALGLGAHAAIQAVWGYSILTLTWTRSVTTATIGTIQWWMAGIVSLSILAAGMREDPWKQ